MSSQSHFFANLARMKLIYRWPLMRNVQKENIAEHSLQVAMVAHALTLLVNQLEGKALNAERVALLALYHDATEILTGDLPTPVKYHNPQIASEYKKIELAAEQSLLSMLPPELEEAFRPLIDANHIDVELARLVKDADILCAYTKCLEELNAGNQEFSAAKVRLEEGLNERMHPALARFIELFVPSFSLPLDKLTPTLAPTSK